VDAQEWLKHFSAVVDASLTGVLKPDPGAYAAGVAATGVPADEVVYLDDMPVNVAGGVAAGLQTIEVRYDDRAGAVAEARRLLGLGS
jgi:putative hydrolase of the HAD superfamily